MILKRGIKMKAKRGFTLVEILIVVVILGILAAIVIPQFTEASSEAKVSSLVSNLQTVRSQIELYKIQHNDDLPGTYTGVDFTTALLNKSNQSGLINNTDGRYGKYLQKMPANPFVDDPCVAVTVRVGTNPGAGTAGWCYDDTTGAFNADDEGVTADGTTHSSM